MSLPVQVAVGWCTLVRYSNGEVFGTSLLIGVSQCLLWLCLVGLVIFLNLFSTVMWLIKVRGKDLSYNH